MRAALCSCLLALCLTGCASLPPTQNTPYLPPGVYGVYQDNDIGAINYAAWAFASPANTRNNPVAAAKAVVALEYLPGELRENPRWIGISDSVNLHMTRASDQVRQILGIAPNAPPQLVVNALLGLAWDLQIGNRAAALSVLQSPVFTLPPDRTLALLSNLPYVQDANLSTSRAQNESFPPGGARG